MSQKPNNDPRKKQTTPALLDRTRHSQTMQKLAQQSQETQALNKNLRRERTITQTMQTKAAKKNRANGIIVILIIALLIGVVALAAPIVLQLQQALAESGGDIGTLLRTLSGA